jgi:hypothetical protein
MRERKREREREREREAQGAQAIASPQHHPSQHPDFYRYQKRNPSAGLLVRKSNTC